MKQQQQQQQQKLESKTVDRGEDLWYPEMRQEAPYSVSTHHIDPDLIFVAGLNLDEGAAKIEHITSYEDLMENCSNKADAAIKPAPEGVCKKRKRTVKKKNKEEVECQRMVHIAVERNRRKQMNEHLDVLRSLMPASYIQRGDQASIVGGTIEFVKELELALHSLITRRKNLAFQYSPTRSYDSSSLSTSSDTLPSSRKKKSGNNNITTDSSSLQEQWRRLEKGSKDNNSSNNNKNDNNKSEGEGSRTSLPNVDVEKVGANAFRVRVLLSFGATGHSHGHLLRLVTLLQQSLKLLIRHLYVTTMGHTVFYSFDVQKQGQVCVGDAARVNVEELAFSIQQILLC